MKDSMSINEDTSINRYENEFIAISALINNYKLYPKWGIQNVIAARPEVANQINKDLNGTNIRVEYTVYGVFRLIHPEISFYFNALFSNCAILEISLISYTYTDKQTTEFLKLIIKLVSIFTQRNLVLHTGKDGQEVYGTLESIGFTRMIPDTFTNNNTDNKIVFYLLNSNILKK